MTIKDVIILFKLSVFFFTGYLISGGFVLWTGGLMIFNSDEIIKWVYDLSPTSFGWTGLALIEGAFTIIVLAWFFGFWFVWKIIDIVFGWKDVRQKFPKLFVKGDKNAI